MLPFLYKPAISDDSANWIVSCYEWALENFDQRAFFEKSQLVTPSAEFFPKRLNSPEEMADYILERVVQLSGLEHWPFKAQNAIEQGLPEAPPLMQLEGDKRYLTPVLADFEEQRLAVAYIPEQLKMTQDLTASFAHAVSQHVIFQSRIQPPGGAAFFPQSSEVLASFFGFGLLLANSAYMYRGGCGSCYNPVAKREAAFSEAETVFSLAVYCKLKGIENQQVFKYLKKHLRSSYKNSLKQLNKGNYSLFETQPKLAENWAQVSR